MEVIPAFSAAISLWKTVRYLESKPRWEHHGRWWGWLFNYPGFNLSFTDGAYNTSNAGDLFKAIGTWDWSDEDAQGILLDDGKLITIVDLTENRFVFSFQFSGSGGQANLIDGTSGNYVITVNK